MANEVVGGQAVIEGVMMINGEKKAIAVRNSKNKIIVKKEKLNLPKNKIAKLPFVRGIINLIFMMKVGLKAINYSADMAADKKEEEVGKGEMAILMLISVVFALALFKFLPLLAAKFIVSKVAFLQINNFIPNVIDGILKISIFVLYLWIISLSKETKRIFEYHGAEHKVVRCKEAKEELTAKNAKKFSRYHPRCGTAFVFGVFLISIFVFNKTTLLQNFGLRILLLPIVMGISYEVLKLSGKNEKNVFFKIITAPGMWMQKLTTREPNEEQLEVAIESMKAVV